MDSRRFDDLTRTWAGRQSRRGVLKGIIGVTGGAAALLASRSTSDAAWSTQVCLPVDDQGNYTLRLVPTAAVPLYVHRYGAVLPENGVCPSQSAVCPEACAASQCGCMDLAQGGTACWRISSWACEYSCSTNDDCVLADYPICVTSVFGSEGRRFDSCTTGFCARVVEACD